MQWYIAGIVLVVLYFSNGAVINVEIENVRNIDGNFTDIIKEPVDNIMEEAGVSTSPPLLQDTKTNFNLMPSTVPPRIKSVRLSDILKTPREAASKDKEDNVDTEIKPNSVYLKCSESHAHRARLTETPRFYVKHIQSPSYMPPYAQPPYPQYAGGYPGYPGFPGYPSLGGFPTVINPNIGTAVGPTGLNPNIATVVTPTGNFTIISGFPNGFNTGFPANFFPTAGFPTVVG